MAQYIQKMYSAIVWRVSCSWEESCAAFLCGLVYLLRGKLRADPRTEKKVLLFFLRPVWTRSLRLVSSVCLLLTQLSSRRTSLSVFL